MTSKTLNTSDIQRAFGVTGMTVYNWRKGSPQRPPMPTAGGPGVGVIFKPAAVKAWSKKAGVAIIDPTAFEDNGDAPAAARRSKPGPKPR